jgi:hypothetical protein
MKSVFLLFNQQVRVPSKPVTGQQYELVDKDLSEPRPVHLFGGRSESLGTWIARFSGEAENE